MSGSDNADDRTERALEMIQERFPNSKIVTKGEVQMMQVCSARSQVVPLVKTEDGRVVEDGCR